MRTLFLGSAAERSGKSMIALGLALNHKGKIGYYKPFKEKLIGEEDSVVDQDAFLMRRALDLPFTEDELCPFFYDILKPVTMEDVKGGFEKVRCKCETMLVEGTRDITTGYVNDLSGMAIAQSLQAEIVLISTARPEDMERVAMLAKLIEGYSTRLRGVILNQAPDESMAKLLRSKGINVIGNIPPLEKLKRFNVEEIKDALDAEVVVAEDQLGREVRRVMVGAMMPETALSIMRRYADKAIITGGDRVDIQMAALSTDTSCLVLTGGLYPDGQVISRAYEARVPILVTRHDTLEATERIEHLNARIDPEDKNEMALIKRTVKEHVDLDAVYQ
ncbi:MAG: phosphate acetyltransferase [Methanomassiliicoccales archaeon PtaU1.Bin124]|nr:MAG: phosphate acetyltransferase [Methanomassiliicoccales archaeon PtaU1.Bin124]